MVLAQKEFRRIVHLPQAVLPHFVNAQFGRTSETVLDAAENTVHIVLVTFKLKHGIHDMFQHLGAGYAAFLVDVPYQYDGSVRLFGETQDGGGAFAYLGYASRRRFQRFSRDGLYGIYMYINLFQGRFADDEAIVGNVCQPVGAQLQLAGAFFSGDVEYPFFRDLQYGLQYQG